ncbi:MAG: AAA family ATPase [Actinomycetota bacterium]
MSAGGSLLVVAGPPGAGKSTVSRQLAHREERSMLVEGDAFFGFIAAGGIDPWLPASADQNETVIRSAAAATAVLAARYATVFDGVLGPWFLDTFVTAGGFEELDYVLLVPSEAACLQRVRTRTGHSFHDEDATRQMHAQFAASPIDRRHVVDTTELGVDETVEAVVTARAAGRLRHTA